MDFVKEAKEIKSIDSWDDWEKVTIIVNGLAELDSKEANKQFERVSNLMVNCSMAA